MSDTFNYWNRMFGLPVRSDVNKRVSQQSKTADTPLGIVREQWLKNSGDTVNEWRIGLDEAAVFCEHPTLGVKFATGAFIELIDIQNGYVITITDKDGKEVLFEPIADVADSLKQVLLREDLPEEVQAFALSAYQVAEPTSHDEAVSEFKENMEQLIEENRRQAEGSRRKTEEMMKQVERNFKELEELFGQEK